VCIQILYTHVHTHIWITTKRSRDDTAPKLSFAHWYAACIPRGKMVHWLVATPIRKNIVNWESSSHFYPFLWLEVNNIMKCLKPQSVQEMTDVAGRNMTSMNIITPFISLVVSFCHPPFPHNDEAVSVGMTLDDTRRSSMAKSSRDCNNPIPN